ncbi:tetratricopeptide repeat protein [Tengunoibacter tsumagoiensis]|uniref:HTH luxR-type domain-containing protein n=1 Tax=Tengunoibacter tsumagoiensis TaxID=2014871 RepID=A0A402A1B4_9CHLR|nr:tetratricopeptide repeat protein [Tengunoibacter tsumagoiensis]GCE12839.1 hypothetical protein KTT_26980 [Tengunoibacter tsumagoiensis]
MPYHLPIQMHSTIGRTTDIEEISTLLTSSSVRLLTLTGPGGVGKTRLALEVAQMLNDIFRDGCAFVELAPLREHTFVLPTIAQVLGLTEQLHHSFSEQLTTFLQEKHLLLIIDNAEHVMAMGPQLASLLTKCADLKILVTSRERLHLYGEYEYPVLPLEVPDLEALQSNPLPILSPAMELFVQRAQAANPTFVLTAEHRATIGELCVQLDGLPLAIELAAARIKFFSPAMLLARMKDRFKTLVGGASNLPQRQQTLHNTLEWSYQLLNDEEKFFFRQLGVFTGSWTLAAAEAITASSSLSSDCFSFLSSLVDKSLIRMSSISGSEMRFFALESIRAYARDYLYLHQEELTAHYKHACYYTEFAEMAANRLHGLAQRDELQRLDQETANLWEAMHWVVEQTETTLALRLAVALSHYLHLRGSITEGRNWLEEILSLKTTPEQATLRTGVLYGAGNLALAHNDLPRAQCYLEECEKLSATQHNYHLLALARGALAALALHRGENQMAQELARSGLQVLEGQNDLWGRGILHIINGQVATKQNNYTMAQVHFQLSLKLLRQVGDLRSQAEVLLNVGESMYQRGKLVTALFLYQKSQQLSQEIGDKWSQLTCLDGMGNILLLQGDYAQAEVIIRVQLQQAIELGSRKQQTIALNNLGHLFLAQGNLLEAHQQLKESLRLSKSISYHAGWGKAILGLAELMLLSLRFEDAHRYYSDGLTIIRQSGDQIALVTIYCGQGSIALARQDYEQAAMHFRQALHLAYTIADVAGFTRTLEEFARLCTDVTCLKQAIQLLGHAARQREKLGLPIPKVRRAPLEHLLTQLQQQCGPTIFYENWSAGQNMSLTQIFSTISAMMLTPITHDLQKTQNRQTAVPPQPASEPLEAPLTNLTTRERDVLRHLAAGLTDAHIAERLIISPRTVNTHLRSIYAKLGVNTRSAATRFALDHHLI